MKQLAFISYTDISGKPAAVCAVDILRLEHRQDGSDIILRNGQVLHAQNTVAIIAGLIDDLWDELIVAITG
jgi:hypothetical protein